MTQDWVNLESRVWVGMSPDAHMRRRDWGCSVRFVDDFPVSRETAVNIRDDHINERGFANDAVMEKMYEVSCDYLRFDTFRLATY